MQILHYAFSVRLSARWRSAGGAISDRLGTRVTLINFVLMAIFSGLLFLLTLPTGGVGGSFIAFYGVFLGAVPDLAGLGVVLPSR